MYKFMEVEGVRIEALAVWSKGRSVAGRASARERAKLQWT